MPALAVLAATSFAAPGDSRWAVRFGAVFPNSGGTGVSTDVGFAYGLSYRFLKEDHFSLGAEVQGSVYHANDGNGDGATITVSNLNLLGIVHVPSSKVYVGGTVGFTQATASTSNFSVTGDTKGVYGLLAGVPVSKQWFVEGRYNWSDIPASRGTDVYLGFKF